MQRLTLIAKGLCSFVRRLKRTAVVLESPALNTTSSYLCNLTHGQKGLRTCRSDSFGKWETLMLRQNGRAATLSSSARPTHSHVLMLAREGGGGVRGHD